MIVNSVEPHFYYFDHFFAVNKIFNIIFIFKAHSLSLIKITVPDAEFRDHINRYFKVSFID